MKVKNSLAGRLASTIIRASNSSQRRENGGKVRTALLDYLAAACAGTTNPTARASINAVAHFGGGHCTLIGLPNTASAAAAALHNGLVGHAEELDDSHRYVSGLHLGVTVIPAVLALAEARDASGEQLANAIVCGYEATGRICRCIDKAHRARGFHSTGTIGPFGAAAGCAVLLGLDEQRLAHALGIAASTAAGLFAFLEDGATVKHLHAGRSALDGLMCALLAEGGMTGPATVFEAKEGFFNGYAESYDSEPLDADLGGLEIGRAYQKIHSACGHTFPAIDTAHALREQLRKQGLTPADVGPISYTTYKAAALLRNPTPATPQEARFSIPFIFALALVHGRVSRFDITPAVLRDEAVLAVARRVQAVEDPELTAAFPRLRAGRLTAALPGGKVFEFGVDSPRGMPDNPLSMAELEEKFRTESAVLLSPEAMATAIELVNSLETLPSIRPLMSLLRPAV